MGGLVWVFEVSFYNTSIRRQFESNHNGGAVNMTQYVFKSSLNSRRKNKQHTTYFKEDFNGRYFKSGKRNEKKKTGKMS